MPSMDAGSLINVCRKHFSRYGLPQTIVSDCGRQFVSQAFRDFAKNLDITLTQSSPHYHQSNGKSESAVKIIKTLFRKCRMDNSDPNFALLEWRNTPMEYLNTSPAQLMFNRRCRTVIPRLVTDLKPAIPKNVDDGRERRQKNQAKRYNLHTKVLRPLKMNERVMLQIPGSTRWIPGVIVARNSDRSYDVSVNGSTYKRNRIFIRPTSISVTQEPIDVAPIPIPEDNQTQPSPGGEALYLRRSQRHVVPPNRYGFEQC